jgi:hypothetical protein
MADKIMVVRHAEKPGLPPPPAGVDEAGGQDKDELVVRGWQRAGALAALFSAWGAAAHAGLATPVSIYATAAVHHGGASLRPQRTVGVLAARLGIGVNIEFALGQEADLARDAAGADGPVLIGWHHEAIPALANAILGNGETCPQEWPDGRFDVVWVFDRAGDGWRFSQVPQLLLAGDSSDPI